MKGNLVRSSGRGSTRVRRTTPKTRCRLDAQELGYGSKEDELFAGAPSVTAVKLTQSKMANNRSKDTTLMALDVKCAFLYGEMKRTICIELPQQGDRSAEYETVGKLGEQCAR